MPIHTAYLRLSVDRLRCGAPPAHSGRVARSFVNVLGDGKRTSENKHADKRTFTSLIEHSGVVRVNPLQLAGNCMR